jgi:Asp-tRNA(Asn)/Glu-tRNA(Gln) amidotransferase A subunit family amidase
MFTALPKGLIPAEPYSKSVVPDSAVNDKPLKGMRVAVVREFMVKHTKNDEAISDQLDKEIKTVLRDKLGAELLESVDPLHADDPDVPNLKYTFQDAFAEILPHNVPEYFWRETESGELEFAVPGWDVRTVDYAVSLALHKAPLSDKINLRSIVTGLTSPRSTFEINKYLRERADERVKDWASWVPNAKFKTESARARAQNAIANQDPRPRPGGMSYLLMRSVLEMVVLKVMYENDIDVFVNAEQTIPPYPVGGPQEPEVNNRPSHSCCGRFTALMGAPEVEVPAGYVQVAYDPKYALSPDKTEYVDLTGTVRTQMQYPMPISLMFWAGPGRDADTIKAASAYEGATHHRVPPPAFGPLSGVTQTSSTSGL